MGLVSPDELDADPKLWLSIPHELHESLKKLMERLYPGFSEKLANIHCLECEGIQPFEVVVKDTLERKLCVGYVGEQKKVELLRLTDLK